MPRKQKFGSLNSREGDVDLIDRYRKPLLAHPVFGEQAMPPGKRAWLETFLTQSIERALLKIDGGSHLTGEDLDHLWLSFAGNLTRDGVVKAICDIAQLVHDPDGNDESRGWAGSARATAELFLDGRDVRQILEIVLETTEPAQRASYPGWFGYDSSVGHYRAIAARLLPYYRRDGEWLVPLLDDENAEVRHIAALHLAFDWPALADDTVLSHVIEAAADTDWIWSRSDHFNYFRTGKEQALLALGKFGARARKATSLIMAEIAVTERKVAGLESALRDQSLGSSVAEHNLARWEADRNRRWIDELGTVLRSIEE
jgi:hypothetical protein